MGYSTIHYNIWKQTIISFMGEREFDLFGHSIIEKHIIFLRIKKMFCLSLFKEKKLQLHASFFSILLLLLFVCLFNFLLVNRDL